MRWVWNDAAVTRHTYLCPLRWADMDQLGHVNNVTYVDYLQEARVDMLRVHPPAGGGEELADGVVVVRHEVQYLVPLVFRMTPVRVEVWATEIKASTFTLAYEVFDEHEDGSRTVYLRARSVLAPFVFAEERPRRVTPGERAVLERFLEPHPEPLTPTLRLDAGDTARHYDYECQVRFSDVDAYGHVNNVKYFEYYQEARIALVTAAGWHRRGQRAPRCRCRPGRRRLPRADVLPRAALRRGLLGVPSGQLLVRHQQPDPRRRTRSCPRPTW